MSNKEKTRYLNGTPPVTGLFLRVRDAKIWAVGNSYVFTVPKDYVDNCLVSVGKSYDFLIDARSEETTDQEYVDGDQK